MMIYEHYKFRRINLLSRIKMQHGAFQRTGHTLHQERANELRAQLNELDRAQPMNKRIWGAEKRSIEAARQQHEASRRAA